MPTKFPSFSVWKMIFRFTSRWFVPSHNQGFSEKWVYLQQYSYLASIVNFHFKVGPLPFINGVTIPISRVITPVTHLFHKPIFWGPVTPLITADGAHLVSSCRFRGFCLDVRLPCHGQLGGEDDKVELPKMIRKTQPQNWPEEETSQNSDWRNYP